MKTELEIAKEMVRTGTRYTDGTLTTTQRLTQHKETCERWLKFLEKRFHICGQATWKKNENCANALHEKVKDLKQTIALYAEAGI